MIKQLDAKPILEAGERLAELADYIADSAARQGDADSAHKVRIMALEWRAATAPLNPKPRRGPYTHPQPICAQ